MKDLKTCPQCDSKNATVTRTVTICDACGVITSVGGIPERAPGNPLIKRYGYRIKEAHPDANLIKAFREKGLTQSVK